MANGRDEQYQDRDAILAQQFAPIVAPMSASGEDPDEAYVNRVRAQAVPAAVTPSGEATKNDWASIAAEAARKQMAASDRAAADLANAPREDTASADIQRRIETENKPIPYRDDSGKVLPEYRVSTGRKILRGLAGAGMGLLRGGIPGAFAGAAAPQVVGEAGYNDPNKRYQVAETQRQHNLAADTSSLAASRKAFEDATNRAKALSQEDRSVAVGYKDVGQTANTAQQRETQQQAADDKAELTRQMNDIRAQQNELRQQQINNQDANKKTELDLRSQNLDLQARLIDGKIRELDARAGKEDRWQPGGAGGKGAVTFKDKQAIDRYSDKWYNDQRERVLKDKREARLNAGGDEKKAQPDYAQIGQAYQQRANEFENRKKEWYAAVQGGKPVTVDSETNQPASAPTNQPTSPSTQVAPSKPNTPATQTQPQSNQQTAKPLDRATAIAILQEAKGDKNKARQIAKQRGFKF